MLISYCVVCSSQVTDKLDTLPAKLTYTANFIDKCEKSDRRNLEIVSTKKFPASLQIQDVIMIEQIYLITINLLKPFITIEGF